MGLSDLTVFVVADDDRSRDVREAIAAWTVEGLVDPSVWVSPLDLAVMPAGPPRVEGEYLGADERSTDDLFRIVGRRRRSTVRVVVGQLIGLDGAHDEALVETGRLVARALSDAIPRTTDGNGYGTSLRCLNVVVPVSGASGVSSECLIGGWDVNVVVSAEDRPDVDRASTYVRDPGNIAGHAATALAACGGVLTGIDEGVLDVLGATSSTSNGVEVQLLRVSVRAVVGQDMESRLAVRALAAVEDEPLGAGTFVEWGRLAADPQRVVADITDNLLRSDPWGSGRPAGVRSVTRAQTAPWDAIKEAVRFDVGMFPTVVRWIAGRKKAELEDRATALVVGEDGDTQIRFEPASPDRIAADAARHLHQVDQRAHDAEIERESAAVAFPDPGSWGALRDVAFAAVDGGALPDAVPEPRYAGVREILAPGRVVPDVLDVFVTSSGVRLVPSDPVAVRSYRLELGHRIQSAQRAVVPGEPDASSDGGGVEPSPAQARKHADAEARLERLGDERDRLDAWIGGAEQSVLWLLADDIGRRRFDYAGKQVAARERMTTEVPPHEALVRAKKRLTGWWYTICGTWLLALLVAAALLAAGESTEIWDWVAWLGGISVVAVVLLGVGNHRFYKAVRTYEWDLATTVQRRQRTSEEIIFYGRESRRLGQLYGTLVDWIAIISWVLHHPTGKVVEQADDVDDEVVGTLPAAFGVARTASEDDIPEGTVVQAVRRLHPVGWAAGDFDQAYDAFRSTLASDGDTGFIAADLDTIAGPFNPRRLLLKFFAEGEAATALTGRAVETLRRTVHDELIVLPTRRVTRLGPHTEDVSMPEPVFYEAATRSATTFVVDMFSPAGMTGRKHYAARSAAWLPRLARASGRVDGIESRPSGADVALRADVSDRLALEELRLFSRPTAQEARPKAAVTVDDGVTPSDAVFH
ncbi:hypothetical protein [Cellulosimicrobium sp. Marseille-Q4280]|uniref:hypothetical protein n=1 Tax=Cellulosimicrobium sp. Marseille-Q4280 TaxID=2937992 RepID=UPI00203C937D|nr:hypothetical protein [Cellulosimicrobium sp. Marseille-Q4280]